jgi:hypothetical protein
MSRAKSFSIGDSVQHCRGDGPIGRVVSIEQLGPHRIARVQSPFGPVRQFDLDELLFMPDAAQIAARAREARQLFGEYWDDDEPT